jgi:hypothetical protein
LANPGAAVNVTDEFGQMVNGAFAEIDIAGIGLNATWVAGLFSEQPLAFVT